MYQYVAIFCVSLLLLGCDQPDKQTTEAQPSTINTAAHNEAFHDDNAQTALDYQGIYNGLLPIHKQLVTVQMEIGDNGYTYRAGDSEITGDYSWDKPGNIINLQDKAGHIWLSLFVAENRLLAVDVNHQWMLDEDGQPYVLIKQSS